MNLLAGLEPLLLSTPRSPHWRSVEKAHLARQGWCRYCGTTSHLQVHHILPFHLYPERELDESNLITLCMMPGRECHLRHGHLGDWRKYNPRIVGEARCYNAMLSAPDLLKVNAWAFVSRTDGDDLLVPAGRATCFGGDSDPQDNGQTASGFNTRAHLNSAAVALPMNGKYFPGLSAAEHDALDDSPIPRIPWLKVVYVTVGTQTEALPVVDLGPARRTGNAIDLTPAAARLFDKNASAVNFAAKVSYRIPGGALLIHAG